MRDLFVANIQEHLQTVARLAALAPFVNEAIDIASTSLRGGGKLMFCGNGGSAAASQHLAAEFTGRFVHHRKPLAAIALSMDASCLTSIGNDYSFSDVFCRQLVALGKKGDCLIGISTSGNSENVIKAAQWANELGIRTIGLLGWEGGRLASICDCSIIVPSNVAARIQEAHMLIGHTICGAVEQRLGLVPTLGA